MSRLGSKFGDKISKVFRELDDAFGDGQATPPKKPEEIVNEPATDVVEAEAGIAGGEIAAQAEGKGGGEVVPHETPAEGEASTAGAGAVEEEAAAPTDQVSSEAVNTQTGGPITPQLTDEQIMDAVYEVGSPAEHAGPVESEQLAGRQGRFRNINLDFFAENTTKRTIDFMNKAKGGFLSNPARRVVSHEATLSKSVGGANTVGELRDRLAKITGGSINDKWEPEDLVGIYETLDVQARELHEYAMELRGRKDYTQEEFAHFRLLSTRLAATQEIASVRAAEAGRMLNALQAVSKSVNRDYSEQLTDIVRQGGGDEVLKQQIKAMGDVNPTLADIVNTNRVTWKTKLWNTALQWRYNMMLSSFRTHAANITGSAAAGLFETLVVDPTKWAINNIEFGGRAVVNAVFGKGGMKPEDRVTFSELVPEDPVESALRAFSVGKRVFMGEELGEGKIYNEMGIRGTPGDDTSYLPQQVQIPTRLLEAEDAVFKSMYADARLRQLAKRKAILNGSTKAERQKLYNEYMAAPSDDMVADATEHARRLTFTNDPSYYGSILTAVTRAVEAGRQHSEAVGLIIPFVRTPMNLLGYALQNSTGGLHAFRTLHGQLTGTPEQRADAMARLSIAAGLFIVTESLVKEGKITGAPPSNYGEYRVREEAGWRANSIKIGNDYYQLNRADPLGLLLLTNATIHESISASSTNDLSTAILHGIVEAANQLTDRSILSGLGDLQRVFAASESTFGRQTGKFAARIATSFIIPALSRDFRNAKDEYIRSLDVPSTVTGGFGSATLKAIKNAVPYLSESLPPQVDVWGGDRINAGGAVYRGMMPLTKAPLRDIEDIDAIGAAGIALRLSLGKPDHMLMIPGTPNLHINLLDADDNKGWVYRRYQQVVGGYRLRAMQSFVESSAWANAVETGEYGPDSYAKRIVDNLMAGAMVQAKVAFLKELEEMDTITPTVGGEQVDDPIPLKHQYSKRQYVEYSRLILQNGMTKEDREMLQQRGYDRAYKPGAYGMPEQLRVPTF